jgi:hypothetical protein
MTFAVSIFVMTFRVLENQLQEFLIPKSEKGTGDFKPNLDARFDPPESKREPPTAPRKSGRLTRLFVLAT